MSDTYEFHEASNIDRLLQGEEFAAFCDGIKTGLLFPIWLYEVKILDGRNRYRACKETGTELKTLNVEDRDDYDPETFDPVMWVVKANQQRRQDDKTERAMAAARADALWDKMRAEAKERQKEHGGTAPGKPKNTCVHVNTSEKSRDAIGKIFKTSGASVGRAKRVINNGTPELAAAVDAKQITVTAASEIAKLPHGKQQKALEQRIAQPKRTPRREPRKKPTGKVPRNATISERARLAMAEVEAGASRTATIIHYEFKVSDYKRAKCVVERGTDVLIDAMDSGALTIVQAYNIAGKPESEVNAAIEAAELKSMKKRHKVATGKQTDPKASLLAAVEAIYFQARSMEVTGKALPDSPKDLERLQKRATCLKTLLNTKFSQLITEVQACLRKTTEQKTS